MLEVWPTQRDMNLFYGDPRGKDDKPSLYWEINNLTRVVPPYQMTYAGKPIKAITVHEKCADSLTKILANIWYASGKDQKKLDNAGASIYGGGYVFRLMRGGHALSTHAWGAAIDLDPVRNGMGDTTPNFLQHMWVVECFEEQGWIWGGRWKGKNCDGMHFQAARLD